MEEMRVVSEAETKSRWVGWRELVSEFGVGDDDSRSAKGLPSWSVSWLGYAAR